MGKKFTQTRNSYDFEVQIASMRLGLGRQAADPITSPELEVVRRFH